MTDIQPYVRLGYSVVGGFIMPFHCWKKLTRLYRTAEVTPVHPDPILVSDENNNHSSGGSSSAVSPIDTRTRLSDEEINAHVEALYAKLKSELDENIHTIRNIPYKFPNTGKKGGELFKKTTEEVFTQVALKLNQDPSINDKHIFAAVAYQGKKGSYFYLQQYSIHDQKAEYPSNSANNRVDNTNTGAGVF